MKLSITGITVFLVCLCLKIYASHFCVVMCSSVFGSDGNGIVIKRLNSDEESSADIDDESIASSSGHSSVDAPVAKVPRTSDTQKPSDLLIGVCSML